MQKAPQSICANAGIAPSAKLKMTPIRTDRIMAFTQQKIETRVLFIRNRILSFYQISQLDRRPALFLQPRRYALERVVARRRVGAAMRPAGRVDGVDEASAQPDRRIGAVEFVIGAGIDDDLGAGAAAEIGRASCRERV